MRRRGDHAVLRPLPLRPVLQPGLPEGPLEGPQERLPQDAGARRRQINKSYMQIAISHA